MSEFSNNNPEQSALGEFYLRAGIAADIEAMALLTERASAHSVGEPLPPTIPNAAEAYGELQKRRHYDGYWSHLAFDADKLAGFTAGYSGTWKGEDDKTNSQYLWLLMVDPDYQRRGLGRALVRVAADASKQNGAENLILYAASDNTRESKLYESEGFEKVSSVLSDTQGELAKYCLKLK
ncbi:MAG: Acetyltransferase family [Candidatus Saccharibacteria bacterium]|nr:Acetyltransferase family [Candidatus Saccharibacteria bacterium]